jgi:hypothetical protein
MTRTADDEEECQMGMFDLIKRDTKAEPRSALEQAHAPGDDGIFGGTALRLVAGLLDSGIDGRGPFDSAHEVAADALTSAGSAEKAVQRVISSHVRMGSASGFVTSVGGFITLPVSLPANVAGFYLIATRMTAAVAELRGYDIDDPQIRSAILLTLVGADSEDLLRKAGVASPSSAVTNLAVQRVPGPALMVVNKAVGFRLLTQAGRNSLARFGRVVPLAGGFIGAGFDAMLMRSVGKQADREFPPRA